eukprot:TRINITY_DN520_c0_g1_i1.p1 TRINITY_DN520_c0_g1~~TRINITY_DN520_c0_g1_i1.p1  ORF type:complete len:344 (+),score=81.94 TRINITY_DN520_c0_g1_i1:1269-2300(+)
MVNACYAAAQRGELAALKLLHAHDQDEFPWHPDLAEDAAESGCPQTVQWLLDGGCPWDADACCRVATENSSCEVLMLLQERGVTLPRDLCDVAWESDLYGLFTWLHQQGCPVSKQLEHDMVRSGDQDILARLHERGHKFHDGGRHACDAAVIYDQAHIIDWLIDARIYRPNKKTMAAAVAVGAVQAVQSLVHKGCPWDERVILTAVFEGHLDILQFLYSCLPHGEYDADICAQAAAAGRLAVLQWARREGLAWDERVCREAHINGHMDVLQYALEEGCACSDSAMRDLEHHEDVMEWRRQELQRARDEAERREEEARQKELAQLRASCSCATWHCYASCRYNP